MKETMGQIIKRLRKANGFTQEELAEQIGVTFQAVSKWENGVGLPDISQIVPLANALKVSTDVLFGQLNTSYSDEVAILVRDAYNLVDGVGSTESLLCCYQALQDGLERYPNDITLLMHTLEIGISLAYPENDCFDAEHGKDIYKNCVREAELIIKYCDIPTTILRARMIMVLLHAAYNNIEAAKDHARRFPIRADMTLDMMFSFIAHFEGDYKEEDCTVILNKWLSGENNFVYSFSYTNSLNKTFSGLEYSRYEELGRVNRKPEFDTIKGVNRPVLLENMIPFNGAEEVKNVYTENWYNYEKGISKFATMKYESASGTSTYVWIPRFAYKIQDFYLGKSYNKIPNTAMDIVFLRENTDYMANNEVLPSGYAVHPAFADGEVGFWVMIDTKEASSLSAAVDGAIVVDGATMEDLEESHLMKNSEYAAVAYLLRVLGNTQVIFDEKEYVAAVYDETRTDFDSYYSSYFNVNNVENVKGHAMNDTPWDLRKTPVTFEISKPFLMRSVDEGGMFYYEAVTGSETGRYRTVITSR